MGIYEHKVQYYETDQMKVVHHSNYIRWFEECRIEMMEQGGLGYEKMEEAGIICPVVSVCCHYESMAKFGEVVEISPTIEKFNGIRLVISYEAREKQTKELRCTGESSHCFLGRKEHPVNLKKASPDFYTMFSNLAESKGASFGPS